MNARELRVWHWRMMMVAREKAHECEQAAREWEAKHGAKHGKCPGNWTYARNHHRRANFHLGAVQVLNDHPNCIGTTAEDDNDKLIDYRPPAHKRLLNRAVERAACSQAKKVP